MDVSSRHHVRRLQNGTSASREIELKKFQLETFFVGRNEKGKYFLALDFDLPVKTNYIERNIGRINHVLGSGAVWQNAPKFGVLVAVASAPYCPIYMKSG